MDLNKRDYYTKNIISDLSKKNYISKKTNQKYRKEFALNRSVSGFKKKYKQLSYSLYSDKSEGAYIWDVDGNKYIDVTMGFGVHLFGHNPKLIINNLKNKIQEGFMLGPMNSKIGELAQRICKLTNQDRVSFFNSGTEAVMVALRLAKAKSKKNKIIIFKNSYHGSIDQLLALRRDSKSYKVSELIPGIPQSVLNDTYLLDYGTKESIEFIKKNFNQIGAVLIEPLQSRSIKTFSASFLTNLRQVTSDHDVPLIFDEVISGFRFSNGGMQEILNIKADITTYGKVLGGGMPLGVVAGKTEYLNFIDGGYWDFNTEGSPSSNMTFVAGTFCHHPLMISTLDSVLTILENENGKLQKSLNKKTDDFCLDVNLALERIDLDISLINYGSIFRFQIKNKMKSVLYYELQKRGLYIWEGKNCFLSTSHSKMDLQNMKEIILNSVNSISL